MSKNIILLLSHRKEFSSAFTDFFKNSALPVEVYSFNTIEKLISNFSNTNENPDNYCTPIFLLDLDLPDDDCLKIIESIKNEDHYKRIPLLTFSNNYTKAKTDTAYKNHVNCCLKFPETNKKIPAFCQSIYKLWFQTAMLPG